MGPTALTGASAQTLTANNMSVALDNSGSLVATALVQIDDPADGTNCAWGLGTVQVSSNAVICSNSVEEINGRMTYVFDCAPNPDATWTNYCDVALGATGYVEILSETAIVRWRVPSPWNATRLAVTEGQ